MGKTKEGMFAKGWGLLAVIVILIAGWFAIVSYGGNQSVCSNNKDTNDKPSFKSQLICSNNKDNSKTGYNSIIELPRKAKILGRHGNSWITFELNGHKYLIHHWKCDDGLRETLVRID